MSDSQGHRDSWILGLGGSNGDRFATCVECGTKDEDCRNSTKSASKGAWVMPVFEAYAGHSMDTTRCIYDGEQEVGDKTTKLDECKPELSFAEGLNAEELEAEECELRCVSKSVNKKAAESRRK